MQYGGLFYKLHSDKHAANIRKRIKSATDFSLAISEADFLPGTYETCFLIDHSTLTHFCLFRKKTLVATSQRRMELEGIVSINAIPFGKFTGISLSVFRQMLSQTESSTVLRVKGIAWEAGIKVVKQFWPTAARTIDAFEEIRLKGLVALNSEVFKTIALEKDAFGLALEFFGLPRKKILKLHREQIDEAPFMNGVKGVNVREDTMINHDSSILPGFNLVKRTKIGSVIFSKGVESLTLLNVNRTPIENTLGVDLIYYHHQYDSFLLIQYKRMTLEAGGEWMFRLSGKQYIEEVKRMRSQKAATSFRVQASGTMNYRFNSEFLYFKFCKTVAFDDADADLVDGMYVPLGYLEMLEKSPVVLGKGGGKRITYGNVQRHFSNTEFITLVRSGWIGSNGGKTKDLEKVINKLLRQKHSVTIGIHAKS